MPTTPIYALRYPAPTDPADGPAGFQNLAEDVEANLKAAPLPAVGGSLPASPVNGQIARYLVTANGPIWTFVYIAASSSPKWHFLGGAPLVAEVLGTGVTGATTYGDCTSGTTPAGPSVTAPLAGEYDLAWSCIGYAAAAAVTIYMGIQMGATLATDDTAALHSASNASYVQSFGSVTRRSLAGAGTIAAKYRVLSSTAEFQRRRLVVTPARVS